MAYGTSATDADIIAATAADVPCLLADNRARSVQASWQWRTGGSWASGSDDTNADFPELNARDFQIHLPTKATTSNTTTYFLGQLNVNATAFDTVAWGPSANYPVLTSADLEVADSNDYATNKATVMNATSFAGDGRCASFLSTGYTSVEWARFKTVMSGSVAHQMNEVWFGARYQPLRASAQPYDPDAAVSSVNPIVAAGGTRVNYTHAKGQARRTIRLDFTNATEASAFASFFSSANNGCRPFLYWENPGTAPNDWMCMRFEDPSMVVTRPSHMWHTVEFNIIEVSPYLSQA